jgi:methionine sulfoxide reductase heme-binding subunit
MVRRLGRRWKTLHRAVYAVAILGVLHFAWLVKADLFEPATYGLVLAVLLATRAPYLAAGANGARRWFSAMATERRPG